VTALTLKRHRHEPGLLIGARRANELSLNTGVILVSRTLLLLLGCGRRRQERRSRVGSTRTKKTSEVVTGSWVCSADQFVKSRFSSPLSKSLRFTQQTLHDCLVWVRYAVCERTRPLGGFGEFPGILQFK